MKKFSAILLAVIMMLAMVVPAYAADDGKITIQNAAAGETYKIFKLFDALIADTENGDGSIAYTGTIPTELAAYFTYQTAADNTSANIVKAADKSDAEILAAVKTWVEAQAEGTEIAKKTGNGSAVVFDGLAYGYYVITTTQGDVITVVSTNKEEVVYDKNTTEPIVPPSGSDATGYKTVNDENVTIGDTVTYTVKFVTANYAGADAASKRIKEYTIADTLPAFLSDVNVTSITVTEANGDVNDVTEQFDNEKKIVLDWMNNDGSSKYSNESIVEITYTAKVTNSAAIDGNGNKNEVSISYTTTDDVESTPTKDEAIIYTYAAALYKVDETDARLDGAKFTVKGLTVEKIADGIYRAVSYDAASTTQSAEMETNDNGDLYILGLATDVTLTVTETVAPVGYNKLTTTTTMTAEDVDTPITVSNENTVNKTAEELDGTKVVNSTGQVLPETGGMGTTLFYVVGSLMMAAAVVVLVAKKKVAAK